MAFVARKALVSGHGNTRTAAWQHSSLAHHAEPANSSDHRACGRMAGRLVTGTIRYSIAYEFDRIHFRLNDLAVPLGFA